MRHLTVKQKKFVQARVKGNTIRDSVRIAGYETDKLSVIDNIGYKLSKNDIVIKALNKAGLTEEALANSLNIAISSGLGIKATNSDAISGIRLAHELRHNLDKINDTNNTNNIYINEVKSMSIEELSTKAKELTEELQVIDGEVVK